MSASDSHPLAGITLLSGLDEKARERLEQKCRWRTYPAHATIIVEQSDPVEVYFVVSGKVQIVRFSHGGREVHYGDVEDGGHFGELAALDGLPRSANVIAVVDTEIASIPLQAFLELVSDHTDVAMRVMQRLAEIVRNADTRILDLSTLGAHNRVQAELLRLAREAGIENNRAVIAPAPKQAEIAGRVSVVRETVTRVLGDLARDGVVKREQGALHVLDADQLAAMVEVFHQE